MRHARGNGLRGVRGTKGGRQVANRSTIVGSSKRKGLNNPELGEIPQLSPNIDLVSAFQIWSENDDLQRTPQQTLQHGNRNAGNINISPNSNCGPNGNSKKQRVTSRQIRFSTRSGFINNNMGATGGGRKPDIGEDEKTENNSYSTNRKSSIQVCESFWMQNYEVVDSVLCVTDTSVNNAVSCNPLNSNCFNSLTTGDETSSSKWSSIQNSGQVGSAANKHTPVSSPPMVLLQSSLQSHSVPGGISNSGFIVRDQIAIPPFAANASHAPHAANASGVPLQNQSIFGGYSCEAWLFPKEWLGRNGRLSRRHGILRGCVHALQNVNMLEEAIGSMALEAPFMLSRPFTSSDSRILIPSHTITLRCIRNSQAAELHDIDRTNAFSSRGIMPSSTISSTLSSSSLSTASTCTGRSSGSMSVMSKDLLPVITSLSPSQNFYSSKQGTSPNGKRSVSLPSQNISFVNHTIPQFSSSWVKGGSTQNAGNVRPTICNTMHGSDEADPHRGRNGMNECYVHTKPAYVLLWKYGLRRCLQDEKHEWVAVTPLFVPTKWFGVSFENATNSIYLSKSKIIICDNISQVSPRREALIKSWCLAACLEITLRELGINLQVKEIREGQWQGFPEPTLTENDEIISSVIRIVSDGGIHSQGANNSHQQSLPIHHLPVIPHQLNSQGNSLTNSQQPNQSGQSHLVVNQVIASHGQYLQQSQHQHNLQCSYDQQRIVEGD